MTREEYARLSTASVAQGARCLSDFARAALMRAVEIREGAPAGLDPGLDPYQKLARLEQRLEAITEGLELLMRKLRVGAIADSPAARARNDESRH
jgi:hypothetical protein